MSRPVAERPQPPPGAAGPVDLLGTPEAGPAAIRGGAIRTAGYLVGVALSVGSAALLFRHLGVADGGRYVTVLSLVTIAGGVSDAGLIAIGVRELAVREGSERERFARSLIGIRLVLTTAGVAGAVAFAALAGYSGTLVVGTALAGVGLLFQSLQSTLATELMARLRLGWVTVAELLRQLITVLLIVALVLAGAELLPFLAVQIPAALAILGLTGWLVRRRMPLMPSFNAAEMRALMREVLPYSAASAAHVIYFRIAIVLVSLIASAEQTGYFGASFRVVEVLAVIPQLVVGAAFPIFATAARDDHVRLAYALERCFQVAAVAGALVALSLALGAGFVIEVVAGADFAPAADVLRIQALALGATFVGAVWGYGMLSLGMYRASLLVNASALLASAVLTALLASSEGATGAAVATVIAELMLTVGAGAALMRAYPRLRPSFGVLWRVTAAAAAGAAPALLSLPELVQCLIGSAVFLAVALGLRAIPAELLEPVLRRRREPPAT